MAYIEHGIKCTVTLLHNANYYSNVNYMIFSNIKYQQKLHKSLVEKLLSKCHELLENN